MDRLGTLQDAIEEAGKLSGIKEEPEVILAPKRKFNYLDLLSDSVDSTFEGALNKAGRGMQLMYE